MWIEGLDFSMASLEMVAQHHAPWLFGVLILFAILQEDVATATTGLLAAHGHIPVELGFGAILSGILLCDLGIFAAGWFARGQRFALRLLARQRIRHVKRLMKNNLIPAVLITRCLPGMRLPTYFALGFFHANPARFFLVAVCAVSLWSALLFGLSYVIGDQILRTIEGPQFWFAIGVFLLFIVLVPKLVVTRLPVTQKLEQKIEQELAE